MASDLIRCPRVRASCTPIPTSENIVCRWYSCAFLLWTQVPNCLLTSIAGIFFLIHKLVQLIYVGGTLFNNLHLRVQSLVYLVSCEDYTSFQQRGGAPVLRSSGLSSLGRDEATGHPGALQWERLLRAEHTVSGEGAARSG